MAWLLVGCGPRDPVLHWWDTRETEPAMAPYTPRWFEGELALGGDDGYLGMVAGEADPLCDVSWELLTRPGARCEDCTDGFEVTLVSREVERMGPACRDTRQIVGETLQLGWSSETGTVWVEEPAGWAAVGGGEVYEEEGERYLVFELESLFLLP